MTHIAPFLKWAGGKRWICDRLCDLPLPPFSRYIEPFLGSGAVFFSLTPPKAILSDLNGALIETYRAIRDNWRAVADLLHHHQELHSRQHYYRTRSEIPEDRYKRAARLIYLNRTCWNGLYRVNKQGRFNVPIGTKSQVILPSDNFEEISDRLADVKLHSGDFQWAISQARHGDLVYADPPYTMNHENNGFLKYNQRLFAWEDQVRLHAALLQAIRKGAFVIVSNACHESIYDLYANDFTVVTVARFSRISGKRSGRRSGSEYLITGASK